MTQPGGHTVWLEYRTVFQDRIWRGSDQMPGGAVFGVTDPQGGSVPLRSTRGSTWKSGGRERVAVAEFRAAQPGRYRVQVDGAFQPRVLSVGPDLLFPLFKAIGTASAALLGGLGAAIAVGLYAFLKGIQARPATLPQSAAPAPAGEDKLRRLAAIVYGLQAVALLVGVTLIAGVILNYLRRDEVAGTWLESHFTWQIRTFWWTLLWGILGLATAILLVGLVILLAASIWLVYRITRGWSELNEGRPITS